MPLGHRDRSTVPVTHKIDHKKVPDPQCVKETKGTVLVVNSSNITVPSVAPTLLAKKASIRKAL